MLNNHRQLRSKRLPKFDTVPAVLVSCPQRLGFLLYPLPDFRVAKSTRRWLPTMEDRIIKFPKIWCRDTLGRVSRASRAYCRTKYAATLKFQLDHVILKIVIIHILHLNFWQITLLCFLFCPFRFAIFKHSILLLMQVLWIPSTQSPFELGAEILLWFLFNPDQVITDQEKHNRKIKSPNIFG